MSFTYQSESHLGTVIEGIPPIHPIIHMDYIVHGVAKSRIWLIDFHFH